MRVHRMTVLLVAMVVTTVSVWTPVAAASAGPAATSVAHVLEAPPPGGGRTGTTLAQKEAAGGASLLAEADENDIFIVPYTGNNIVTPELLANRVMGGRGEISNATFTGAFFSAGMFTNGSSTFFVRDGILLSSGHVDGVQGPNVSDSITTDHVRPGDASLNTLVPGGGTQDAAVLEFDLVPQSSPISFHLVFASDEYNEYANSQYNDVFGFFVDGQNIAHLPGTTTNISVNSVNGGNPLGTNAVNPQFFNNNDLGDGGTLDTEMDGLTTVIKTEHVVNPGQSYHIKLAIADVGDRAYDSNVLLGAPNDCATFNPDAASVGPAQGDQDEPFFTVKYDPREIVPDNQPGFEAKAEQIATAIRDRAELAADRYRDLGNQPNPNIEIKLTCDVDVDGRVPDEGHIKLKASTISAEFKPIVDSGFAGNTWNSPVEHWVSVVDHEVFHTFQTKKTGSAFIANLLLEIGNGIVVESGAMLGPDFQVDADHLPDEVVPAGVDEKNGFQYIDQTQFLLNDQPSILSNNRYAFGAVFQYWGERFGVPGQSLEHQVAEFYKRLLPTVACPVCPVSSGLDAMQEAIGQVDAFDALRDFYVAAYVRRAENVAGANVLPNKNFRFRDEEEALPGAPYPMLTPVGRTFVNGRIEMERTRENPLEKGGAIFDSIPVPVGTSQIKVTYTAKPTGMPGRGGFPSQSPTRLAFIAVASDTNVADDRTGIVTMQHFATGNKPDQGPQEFMIDVAGREKLGVVIVASERDAAFTMVLETVNGTADVVIDQPTAALPEHVIADQFNQPIVAMVRPTIAGNPVDGLNRLSFTATVEGNAARVTGAVRIGDSYWLLVDPIGRLQAGTHDLSITFGGQTRTRINAVIADAPSAAAKADDAAEAHDLVTSGSVRAEAFFPIPGAAGTPLRLALALSEPQLETMGATVTASITDPAGTTRTFPLRDRGGDSDTVEDDGVYGADVWATDLAGAYNIVVNASGTDSLGALFSFSIPGSVTLTAKVDTDGDGVADAVESRFEMNPAVADDTDHDADGLSLSNELARGTNPWSWDTDDGGENDASEVAAGRDPLAGADDGDTRGALIGGRSLDGNRVEISSQTDDGSGSIELFRAPVDDVSTITLVTTLSGAETVFIDGPLPAGEYWYAAVTVGPTGAKSAPTILGPYAAAGDVTPPNVRMVLEGGLWETADQDVTVAFFDLSEPVTQMRIAESEATLLAAPWVPFQDTSTFAIGAAPGNHLIYGQVRDAAGLTSTVTSGIVEFDPAPPTSSLGSIPAIVSSASVSIPFTATDGGTFIANVELWVRYRATTTAPWGAWALETSASTSPIDYTFAHGEGYYEFYSIAADGAGNREAAPATADSSTRHLSDTPPSAPGNLVATAAAWNRVNLAWTASTDNLGVIRYEIKRNGNPLVVVSGGTTAFSDRSVTQSTAYSYTVTAFDEAGNASPASNIASATTPAFSLPADTVAPTVPGFVNASTQSGTTSSPRVLVSWTKSTDSVGVLSYTVYRNATPILTLDAGPLDPDLLGHAVFDRKVTHGSVYRYTVRANDAAGNSSAVSSFAEVTIPACSSCALTLRPASDIAKNGFTAKSGQTLFTQIRESSPDGDTSYISGPFAKAGFATFGFGTYTITGTPTSVQVQWNAKRILQSGTTGTVSARIELYAGSTLIGTGTLRSLGSSYATYTETFNSVSNWSLNNLQVKINQTAASSKTASRVTWLAVVVTSQSSDTTPPSVPTGLTGRAASDRQIDLSWNDSTDPNGIQGYIVYRNGLRITPLLVATSTFRDVGLSPSTAYQYQVFAQDGRGNDSVLSGPITVTTASAATPPPDTSAPTTPTWGATACVNPSRIDLTWNPSTDSVGVQGYLVFRDNVQVGTLPVGSTSFSDIGLSFGVQYVYTLRAIDGSGNLSGTSAARFGSTCPNG